VANPDPGGAKCGISTTAKRQVAEELPSIDSIERRAGEKLGFVEDADATHEEGAECPLLERGESYAAVGGCQLQAVPPGVELPDIQYDLAWTQEYPLAAQEHILGGAFLGGLADRSVLAIA
jgi:hypothetical protein